MDIVALTDEELSALQQAVDNERERRAILAQSADAADALSEQYQQAAEAALPEGEYLTWERPTGAHNAYRLDQIVTHAVKDWASNVASNVWEPGVSGAWREVLAEGEYPNWYQPLGAVGAYKIGDIVRHDGKLWISDRADNVWEPGTTDSGWTEYTEGTEPPTTGPEAWVQPTGAHDAYAIGAQVTHNGKTWVNTLAANTYEPGVYGWDEVVL